VIERLDWKEAEGRIRFQEGYFSEDMEIPKEEGI
jgi:hypothetical protein